MLADAADGKLDGQAPGDGEALGPPVYAGAHVRRTSVADADDDLVPRAQHSTPGAGSPPASAPR